MAAKQGSLRWRKNTQSERTYIDGFLGENRGAQFRRRAASTQNSSTKIFSFTGVSQLNASSNSSRVVQTTAASLLPSAAEPARSFTAQKSTSTAALRRHCRPPPQSSSPRSSSSTRNVVTSSTVAGGGTSPSSSSSLQSRAPTHPKAMSTLYFMYLCACLVERTWRFALPLCLAYVEGGYQAIAVLGFVSPLACSLLGPTTGRMLDRMHRPYGLGMMITLQAFSIIASGLVVLTAAGNPAVRFAEGPLFAVLLVLSMLERLTAICAELAIERDWVTQLSGKDNAYALASSNAMLRRTDLSCELVGSLAFGWLYTTAGLSVSIAFATFLAAVLLPAQILSIFKIAKLAPDAMVHGRDEIDVAFFKPPWKRLLDKRTVLPEKKPSLSFSQRLRTQLAHSLDGWKAYFKQPILPSSLTFVLLFFNVALSPGGLITAFLTLKGLDGTAMAVFRGGCATMGFVGTWVGRRLIQKHGLLGAGQRALSIQFFFLCTATVIYTAFLSSPLVLDGATASILTPNAISINLIAFSAAVVFSRIGMWSFDMVNAQLFQQNVSQREVASASAAEMALCSSSELLMLGMAAYVIGPQSYKVLIFVSLGAVAAANMLFNSWAKKSQESAGSAVEEDSEEDSGFVTASAA